MRFTDHDLLLKKSIDERLHRIANFLLLNASFIDNIGLLNGKMGIAIFFYHYSRHTNTKIFEEYAGELIDEIYEEINTNTPVNFADGLTGIGWGIEYLVQNRFVEADTNEALGEIDNAIYKHRLNSPVLLESGDDLFGYGFYHIARLRGHKIDDDDLNTLMKKNHLIFLTDECERLLIHKRYLDFNILSLSTRAINSLLWFLLEMQEMELFPVKVRKLLQYLPGYLSYNTKENEMQVDYYILHNLSESAIKSVSDDKIRMLYQSVIANSKSDLNAVKDDHSFLNNLASFNLYRLIYQPYLRMEDLNQSLFERALNIIDNEEDWNNRLDQVNKSNLGLTGFAGLGLYILNEVNGTESKRTDYPIKQIQFQKIEKYV